MSKMTQTVKENKKNIDNKAVTNFMGGVSYEINPIDTLKMVTSSSIFGEPQYYRDGEFAEKTIADGVFKSHSLFKDYLVLEGFDNKKTSAIMEEVIDKALSYNFKETLEWALNLRMNFNMRLNPQVIMVRAASHQDRLKFTAENPGLFDEINHMVPHLGNINPSGKHLTESFWFAGGIPYVQLLLKDILDLDVMTVTGKTLGENLEDLQKDNFFERNLGYLYNYKLPNEKSFFLF